MLDPVSTGMGDCSQVMSHSHSLAFNQAPRSTQPGH